MDETADKLNEAHLESDYHRQDEQVNVCLECNSSNLTKLQRRFIRCSSQATITHLKKFVAKKVFDGIDKYREVGEEKKDGGEEFYLIAVFPFPGGHLVQ